MNCLLAWICEYVHALLLVAQDVPGHTEIPIRSATYIIETRTR